MSVDFSTMNERSLKAIWFLSEAAERLLEKLPSLPALPIEVSLYADKPETPLAIFSVSDTTITTVYFDEAEMFRAGRGSTLHVRLPIAKKSS
jgi:hypothetical protein